MRLLPVTVVAMLGAALVAFSWTAPSAAAPSGAARSAATGSGSHAPTTLPSHPARSATAPRPPSNHAPTSAQDKRAKSSPDKKKAASKQATRRRKGSRGRGKHAHQQGKHAHKRGKHAHKRGKHARGRAPADRRRHRAKRPRPKARRPGSKPGEPNETVRQVVTGQHPNHYPGPPTESAELEAIRQLDRQLFPPVAAPDTAPWQTAIELPEPGPAIDASGLPQTLGPQRPSTDAGKANPSWVTALARPDIAVRFDPSVVRYLDYYKNNPRGRALLATWVRRSGRYRKAISRLLRAQHLPQALLWVALVESAFSADAYSHAGAAGLWQFMPATGRIYGLTVNRRVDERLDPERATVAALRHLGDLKKRFGRWELALAAYNMGYGGVLASIRRFNTNDYWELRRLEAGLPYETALYVPKILAIAVATNNCKVFGCDQVTLDRPLPFGGNHADQISVAPGVTLKQIAKAANRPAAAIKALNPQLIGSHLPPIEQASKPADGWVIRLPRGTAHRAAARLPHGSKARTLGTHRVRWGEHLDHIAAAYGTSEGLLRGLNDLYPYESPRPGSTVFVPRGRSPKPDLALAKIGDDRPSIVVPAQLFSYAGRRRVFYEPVLGDTVEQVAQICGVTAAEIRRWNHLAPAAKLQSGMHLQLFIPASSHPRDVLVAEESQVRVLVAESPEFFDHFVSQRGRKRLQITVGEGDTWRKLGKRYGLSLGLLERINGRSRRSPLRPGDRVVVYASRMPAPPAPPPDSSPQAAPAAGTSQPAGPAKPGPRNPAAGLAPRPGTSSGKSAASPR